MTQRPGAVGTDFTSTLSAEVRQGHSVTTTFDGAGSFSALLNQGHFVRPTFAGAGGFSADASVPPVLAYLRPDADDTDGGWTTELGGTNLFPSIDEASFDDADYIQSSIDPHADICRFRISNPAGTVKSTGFKVRTRYKRQGSTAVDLRVRLKQGSTEIASWTYPDISTSFVTTTETLTAPQFAAISDFNDLFIEIQAGTITDDDDVNSWIESVQDSGGSVSAGRTTHVYNLVTALKSDGLWSKLDRLWLLAAENETSALTDLVASASMTKSGTPTFTTDRGYVGGSGVYLDTNFDILSSGVNYTQDSATVGTYIQSGSGGFIVWDAGNGIVLTNMRPQHSAGNTLWTIHCSDNELQSSGGNTGQYIITRTGSSAQAAYKNGSSFGTSTRASSTRPSVNMRVLGNGSESSTDRIASFALAGAFNSTEAAAFDSRINTYMTAVGANVY